MVADFILHDRSNRFFDLMDARITIFIHPAADRANNVIVLLAGIGFFKLRDILAELVLDHQTAIKQQFHRIVQRGTADAVTIIFHVDIQ
jgi:hypothetical protein